MRVQKSEDFKRSAHMLEPSAYLVIIFVVGVKNGGQILLCGATADLFSFIVYALAQKYHFPYYCLGNLVIKGPCGKLYSKFVSCNLTVSYVLFVLLDCCIILFVSTFLTTDC